MFLIDNVLLAPVSGVMYVFREIQAAAEGEAAKNADLQSKFFDNSDTTLDGLNQINLAMSQADSIVLNTGTTYQQQAAQVIASEILIQASGIAGRPAVRQPVDGQPAGHQRADHARGVRERRVPDHQRAAC